MDRVAPTPPNAPPEEAGGGADVADLFRRLQRDRIATLNNGGASLQDAGLHEDALKRYQRAVRLRIELMNLDPTTASVDPSALASRRDEEAREVLDLLDEARTAPRGGRGGAAGGGRPGRRPDGATLEMYRLDGPTDPWGRSALGDDDEWTGGDGTAAAASVVPSCHLSFSRPLQIDTTLPSVSEAPDDRLDAAVTMYNMGLAHSERRSLDKALRLFRMATTAFDPDAHPVLAALILNNAGQVHFRRGELQDAGCCFERALVMERIAICRIEQEEEEEEQRRPQQQEEQDQEQEQVMQVSSPSSSGPSPSPEAERRAPQQEEQDQDQVMQSSSPSSLGASPPPEAQENGGNGSSRKTRVDDNNMEPACNCNENVPSPSLSTPPTGAAAPLKKTNLKRSGSGFVMPSTPREFCHGIIVTSLSFMGRIHMLRNELAEALEYCRETLRLCTEHASKKKRSTSSTVAIAVPDPMAAAAAADDDRPDIDVAIARYNLSLVYQKLGHFDMAAGECRSFLQWASDLLGEAHPFVAVAHQSAGVMHLDEEQYEVAVSHLTKSLEIAQVLQMQRRAQQGQLQRPPDHAQDLDDLRTAGLSQVLYFLGRAEHGAGHYRRAMEHFQRALRIERAVALRPHHPSHQPIQPNHEEVATILCGIGNIHRIRGELDEALAIFQEAIRIISHMALGDQDRDRFVSSMLTVVGNIHLERGETDYAMASFTDAHRINTLAQQQQWNLHGDMVGGPMGDDVNLPLVVPDMVRTIMSVECHPAAAAA